MKQLDISEAKYIKQDKSVSYTYAEDTNIAEIAADGSQELVPTEGAKALKKKVALSELSDEEIEYVCNLITPKEIQNYFQKYPKEFARIRPGWRVSSLSDDYTIALVCKNKTRSFVASFLENRIKNWLLQFQEFRDDLEQKGASPEESLLLALPKSVFSDNIELFFKVAREEYPVEYITLARAALLLLKDQPVVQENENSAAAAIEQDDVAELSTVKEQNVELLTLIEHLRQEIKAEKTSHGETCELLTDATSKKIEIQRELDAVIAQNTSLADKVQLMETELNHFNQLSKYADTQAEDTYSNEYEYTSICEVFLDYAGQPKLSRLADIKDGKIIRFTKNEDSPHYFGNRDRLFWKNGPREEGYIGVWQWNAEPNKSDPSTDYVTTAYASNAKVIEIIELSGCRTYDDIAQALKSVTFSVAPGRKMLFVCCDNDGQMIGLLCNERDYDANNGTAKLKSTVYTLPQFDISSTDILAVSGKKIYGFTSLGMPEGVFQIRNPLVAVKEFIISRATSAALRQQGLTKKEAQHCQSFLKDLPLQTLFQDIAEAYLCTEAEAKEYISTFIKNADSYLSENDIDVGTLAVALERNRELINKCKELLTATWEYENADKLHQAQQQLEEIEGAVSTKNTEIAELEATYRDLQNEKAEVQAAIATQIALASDVELKVANRIAAAKKNAADFICEMAFAAPERSIEEHPVMVSSGLETVLTARKIEGTQGEEIKDADTFVDELADNLNTVGYDDIIAAHMALLLTFCIENHLPIVCGSNALRIADCVAAMFGESGAYTTTLSISQPDCPRICAAIQNESVDKKCVVVVNGVFDGLSLNGFNEIILHSEIWGNNVILLFPLNGVDITMIPNYVWGQTMFIDGDVGLNHLGTDKITIHTTTAEFGIRCTYEETAIKRKQLKALVDIVSNTAMLNYAKFMAETDSSLKDDNQILLQITLHALSGGKKDQLLKILLSLGIDLLTNKEISRYL